MSTAVQHAARERSTFPGMPAAFAIGTYVIARMWVPRLPEGSRLAILLAFLPMLPYAIYVLATIRRVRGLDELERRIHLEALAFAFPTAVILLMTIGLLELTMPLPRALSYRAIWLYLPILYGGALWLARRRYR
jgi:hypothetical protein